MINTIKLDGVVRERRSNAMFTRQYDSIEIQCYECGSWKDIRRLLDTHFTEKFVCGGCKRKATAAEKRKNKPIKVKAKPKPKPKKIRPQWPENCPHRNFFRCSSRNQCQGCYYNPTKKIALMAKYRHEADPNEKKIARDHWFYGNKSHVKKALGLLDDIKQGKGLFRNGRRCYFKHTKNQENNDEY